MKNSLAPIEAPESLNDRVFAALSDAIVRGGFDSGQPLVAVEIAELLGVSRTPVRSALVQLEKLGLVTVAEDNRYVVPSLSLDDLENLYAVRSALEGLAAHLAAPIISNETLAELEQNMAELSHAVESSDLDNLEQPGRFHRIIVDAANNPRLTYLHHQIDMHIQRYRMTAITQIEVALLRSGLEEHRGIYRALAAHDRELAEARARDHVDKSKQRLSTKLRACPKIT